MRRFIGFCLLMVGLLILLLCVFGFFVTRNSAAGGTIGILIGGMVSLYGLQFIGSTNKSKNRNWRNDPAGEN